VTLWNFLKPHIFWVALVSVALVLGHSWLAEHDSRIVAEQTVKVAQDSVKTLQAQLTDIQKQGQQKVAVIQQKAAQVKTPAQAIAAIPDVSTLPLHSQPIPQTPTQVAVDALALYQELATARATDVRLETCQDSLNRQTQISNQQNLEIVELKRKPAFWHRVGSTLKTVGVGIGIGFALGVRI
jgi:hypothetical protein